MRIRWAEQVKYGRLLHPRLRLLPSRHIHTRPQFLEDPDSEPFQGFDFILLRHRRGHQSHFLPPSDTWPSSLDRSAPQTAGPLGPNVILIAGLALASGLPWINQYYYLPRFYGSASLYLKSEWIAMATLPFVL